MLTVYRLKFGSTIKIFRVKTGFYSRRSGLTLVETLVVVAIVAILIGLSAVSIGAMRESARRVHCENNLRQFGVSLLSFEGVNGHLPARWHLHLHLQDETLWGPFVALSPYLEITEVSDFQALQMPQVFQCPSAPDGLSYRFNVGPVFVDLRERNRYDGNGVVKNFDSRGVVYLSDVTDGLSNTAALAERMTWGTTKRVPAGLFVSNSFHDMQSLQESCAAMVPFQVGNEVVAEEWFGHWEAEIGYDHFKTPNSTTVDCHGALMPPGLASNTISARGKHAGGVFAVKLDGSVFWTSDTVDQGIWRAIGSRSSDESYWATW